MPDPVTIGPGGRGPGARPLLRTILGDVLRRTRQTQRRTLAEVARAARVSMPYLSELERGRKEASSEVLAAICDALEIELSDLLAEVGRTLAKEGSFFAREARLIQEASPVKQTNPAEQTSRAEQTSLVEDTGRPGTVVRLDAFRARRAARPRRAAPPQRGPGDVQLQAAA